MHELLPFFNKHKGRIALVVAIIFSGPLLIVHFLFNLGAPIDWLVPNWNAGDLLGYFAAFFTLTGTIILSYVAIWQGKKAIELNRDMLQLEQANYISMISLMRLEIHTHNLPTENVNNLPFEIIDFRDNLIENQDDVFYADADFMNDSNYPIVQINASASYPYPMKQIDRVAMNKVDVNNKSVYIGGNKTVRIRFIFNRYSEIQKNYTIGIFFFNIFNYPTKATLHIEYLSSKQKSSPHWFRLAKFVDINPNKKDELEEHNKKVEQEKARILKSISQVNIKVRGKSSTK